MSTGRLSTGCAGKKLLPLASTSYAALLVGISMLAVARSSNSTAKMYAKIAYVQTA
ncbi:MAG: hypothetical protein QW086_08775 [Pyrobaculum sp.]